MAASGYLLHSFEEWRMLIKECENEWKTEYNCPTVILGAKNRKYIWDLSQKLDVNIKGMPALVCRILEMFMARQFMIIKQNNLGFDYMKIFKERHENKMLIYLLCCITIVTKYHSSNMCMDLFHQTAYMYDFSYDCKQRLETEFSILQTLNFQIPTMTSFDIMHMILIDMRLPLSWHAYFTAVLDSAELHRLYIQDEMKEKGYCPKSSSGHFGFYYIPSLHLTVGALAASFTIYHFMGKKRNCAIQVTNLARLTMPYVELLSNSILKFFYRPLILNGEPEKA